MNYTPLWCALVLTAVCSAAHARYLFDREVEPIVHLDEENSIYLNHGDRLATPMLQFVFPDLSRHTRQVHGFGSLNPNGGLNLNLGTLLKPRLRIMGQTDAALSAFGSVSGLGKPGSSTYNSASAGLALNKGGNSASVALSRIPGFGHQLTGAGNLNLFNNGVQKIDAGASITRSFPNANTGLPNFNTFGGNLGVKFNDRLGATLSAARTPLFQKTDVSAMGNLNIFKNPTTSLDFNGGLSRSFSPFMPRSSWQPSFGLTLGKYF